MGTDKAHIMGNEKAHFWIFLYHSFSCFQYITAFSENANTVVSDDNFYGRRTKIPYIGFHLTTIFLRHASPISWSAWLFYQMIVYVLTK